MTAIVNAVVHLLVAIMENIAAKTSTFNGTAFDTQDYEGVLGVTLFVGAVSGTSPTLDGKLQSSTTSGGTYADIPNATFTQVTAANALQKVNIDLNACDRYIRFVGTIAGTSPSFTMGVTASGIKKY